MFCMLCLNETQVGLKVFSDEGNYLQVDKTIRKHFWIVPIEHDEYSNTVCYSCWGLVHSFNDFYKKVEEAHQKHQKTPTKKNVVPIITKIETQTFQHNEQYEDQMEDSNFMEDDFDDPLNPNPSVSVSEEYEPEVIPAKRKRSSTSYKVYIDEDTSLQNETCESEEAEKEDGRKRRSFVKKQVFASAAEALEYVQKEKAWSKINCHTTKVGEKHYYRCNAVKRRSAVKCPANMYLLYSKYDETVTLYLTKEDHKHDNCTLASQVIEEDVKNIIIELLDRGVKCKEIYKELLTRNVKQPTEGQLRTFIRTINVQKSTPDPISITELRHFLEQNQMVPLDEHEPYISNYSVEENVSSGAFRFFVTTKKLMNSCLEMKTHVCIDTNHKLIWQGFPIFVVGSTDLENKFHCFGLCIASAEEETVFSFIFQTLQTTVTQLFFATYSPTILLSDHNTDLQTSFVQTFEGKMFLCHESVFKMIAKKIENLKIEKTIKKDILEDLRMLQLSTSDNVFHVGVRLFCDKYCDYQDFIHYFKTNWVVKSSNWYEGFKGFEAIPMSNSAMQTFVGDLRRRSVIRERFGLEEFQQSLLQCIRAMSEDTCTKYISLEPNITKSVWMEGQAVASGDDEITTSKKDCDAFYSVHKFNLTDWRCITSAKTFSDFSAILPQNIIVRLSHTNWKLGFCFCDKFYKDFICKHIIGVAVRNGRVDPTQFMPKSKTASLIH